MLDGRFADDCWLAAPSIGEFIQVEPVEGLVPGHATIVRIVYSPTTLYIAIQCFDDRPDEIRASLRQRDADLDPDDRIEMIVDPFGVGNQAYFFQVGAGGSIGDALMSPNSFTKSWDTIWDGRTQITDDGWQAELAIPFRSVAFSDDGRGWGFNIRRVRRWTNDSYRWHNATQTRPFFRISELGLLEGIEDVERGVGIDVVPYVAFSQRRQRISGSADWDEDPDAGGEVFVRLSPSLDAAITYRTDFAQTENDSRQINLGRFPLFFGEKRDFFLQDEARFRFGPGDSSLLPFFSRRIGLGSQGEIPIEVGAKVTGQAGPWGVGFLGVNTAEGGGNDFRRDLGVLRVDYALADQTRVGAIGTSGRPVARGSNEVAGVDFYHRQDEFLGDTDLRLWGYGLVSNTSGAGGDGTAGGLRAVAAGREIEVEADARWIQSDFNPELGRVRRRGIHDGGVDVEWTPRSDLPGVRAWRFGAEARTVLDESLTPQDYEVELKPFGFRMHSGDSFLVEVSREFERVDQTFTVFDNVDVMAGDYWTSRVDASIGFSEGRLVSGSLSASHGDFYDGESTNFEANIAWRASPLLILGGEFEQTDARLRGGDFTSQVAEARADLHFTPRLSVLNLAQYDNESRNLGLQSRTRWIVEPGSDLFVVVTAGWVRGTDDTFRPDAQELAIKLSYTIRF